MISIALCAITLLIFVFPSQSCFKPFLSLSLDAILLFPFSQVLFERAQLLSKLPSSCAQLLSTVFFIRVSITLKLPSLVFHVDVVCLFQPTPRDDVPLPSQLLL